MTHLFLLHLYAYLPTTVSVKPPRGPAPKKPRSGNADRNKHEVFRRKIGSGDLTPLATTVCNACAVIVTAD